ncbi:thiazole biosynthesis adenylyltransferase ThiF [Halobacillus mangrovi]|uniref:thiazole biosynthesis adenylyltransferase ThiF n=1 Tax=Halobacillus mangrovi TaxID=402384 RepID=UPI003D99C12C
MLSDRYSRQQLFQPIGERGQQRLSEKHVLIIGAGALGTSSSEQLVRAGVGRLTIVDRDYVEGSNLQRQQLFSESDALEKLPKAVAAKKRLAEINSDVSIVAKVEDVQAEELEIIIKDVDLILDATDNFETRMLINDMSQKYRIPWIYGACVGSHGMSYTVVPTDTPCLNCLMETIPLGGATCDTVGVISPAVQMVTAHQVAEALKILVGDFESLHGKLITFDLWNHQYSGITVSNAKNPECSSCGTKPTYPFLSHENQTKTAVLCGRETVQIRPSGKRTRDLDELRTRLPHHKVKQNPFLLSYEDESKRMVFFNDGRVLIHGTKDVSEAKSLYHKIVGG